MCTKKFTNDKFLIASWLVNKKTLMFFTKILNKSIQAVNVRRHDLEIKVNSNNIYPVLYFLQKHTSCRFDCLTDIVCYDDPSKTLRFGIIYNMTSFYYNSRIRLISKFSGVSALLSAVSLFSGAAWMEREILDMFGIYFCATCCMVRIIMCI